MAIDQITQYKQQAAEHAVTFVQSGMIVGLGTGSTAIFATRRIGQLLREGDLTRIVGIPTSSTTAAEARQLGIPLLDEAMPRDVDVTIDGADEVNPALDLIKGGGGALLREKIVAQASRRVIVVVDESKLSPALGTRFFVPVEVLPFGWQAQARYLESLSARVVPRQARDGALFATDQGNLVLDCTFGPIDDPAALAMLLDARAGIVGHGLFLGLTTDVIVAGASGIRHLKRS
jgi:ribose 5-phosphate isomerase A